MQLKEKMGQIEGENRRLEKEIAALTELIGKIKQENTQIDHLLEQTP